MAAMPAPGVVGSRKATKKPAPALYACGAGATRRVKDPAEFVKRIGEACASAGAPRMHAIGPVIRGQQADKDVHQEHPFRVAANKCYRVYFATDETVQDAVVGLRDSVGAMVAESAGIALPEDGTFCFASEGDVTLLVAIGAGTGSYAAQVWSD
jgi:hypothetical protein